MGDTIVISTGARLHFGFLAHCRSIWEQHGKSVFLDIDPRMRERRSFGGAGLMIDSPGFVLAVSRAAEDQFVAGTSSDEPLAAAVERVADFVARYRRTAKKPAAIPACRFEMRRAVSSHLGLGSGTQLGMAAAAALAELSGDGRPAVDARLLAERVGRGKRSAIGVHGFVRGGFLVDGGKCHGEPVAPLVARSEIPAAWRFLLVWPSGRGGRAGRAEQDAFARLPEMPLSLSGTLCRLVLLEMLPGLAEADIERFGQALYEYGSAVGDFFRPVQGGRYADPSMAALADWLRRRRVAGVAQSSWGPTLAACCPDETSAAELRSALLAESRFSRFNTHIAAPLNAGASISRA